MRIVTTIVLLALSGFAVVAGAAKEPTNLQENRYLVADKGGKEVSAKNADRVVRARSGASSFNVSDVMGRR